MPIFASPKLSGREKGGRFLEALWFLDIKSSREVPTLSFVVFSLYYVFKLSSSCVPCYFRENVLSFGVLCESNDFS
jgi:hypothetical protein